MESKFYQNWHLAKTDSEYRVTEFEWSIIRFYEAFSRWVTTTGSVLTDADIKFSEHLILHVIRMQNRPKSSATIARMINRDDIPNIQYSLRKLESAKLIRKTKEKAGKIFSYSVTEAGRKDRVDAGKIADQVQRELRASIEQALYTAQAMGESVVPFNTAGAVRVRERDGLWGALESGVITSAMAEAGFEYRARFEAAGAEQLGSQLGRVGEGMVKASSSHGATARGLFRAYAGVQVTTAEAHVLTADPTQRALTVLRAVAGEGRTIRSLGQGGNARAANGKALAVALPIVARSLTETGGLRIRAA